MDVPIIYAIVVSYPVEEQGVDSANVYVEYIKNENPILARRRAFDKYDSWEHTLESKISNGILLGLD